MNRNTLLARLRSWRAPKADPLATAVTEALAGKPGQCRLCDERADVQLVATIVRDDAPEIRAEPLCFEHIGPFVQLWGDPRVAEWTVIPIR